MREVKNSYCGTIIGSIAFKSFVLASMNIDAIWIN